MMAGVFNINLQHQVLSQGQVPSMPNTNSSDSYLTIDGIECDVEEHFNFHGHAKLDINIDGKPYPIPEGIGIIPQKCIYWLHTHDNSSIIHIESPMENTFTLGQFLNIWNAFDSSNIVEDIANNSMNIIGVPINGEETSSSIDYRGIKLIDNAIISINFTK